jgi:Tol biopolymer transport system component
LVVLALGVLAGLLSFDVRGATVDTGARAVAADHPQPPARDALRSAERHLANIRQLTAGRQNAEAYFSFDGTKLIFQSTNDWGPGTTNLPPGKPASSERGLGCYQMYVLDLETNSLRRVSLGTGATTCGYFFPGGRRVLFSSTHLAGQQCPPKPKREGPYRWSLDDYDIFAIGVNGQGLQRLTATPGYDAEATISPDGKTIVFTSMRDGDLDLYAMNLDGTHLRRLTTEIGYDGGAFFSPDSTRIVYRASHPKTPAELDAYRALLAQHLVEPGQLEIFVMNADGSGKRQVTSNGASNFAPFFHPDGKRIIFASNLVQADTPVPARAGDGHIPSAFHLYLINDDGTGLEQVTTEGRFNSFPMFSPDGTRLVWVSDRHASEPGEFNLFMADWVP